MNPRRWFFHPVFLALALSFSGCKGCGGGKGASSPQSHSLLAPKPENDAGPSGATDNSSSLKGQEIQLISESLFPLVGQIDSENRYSSTVMVSASIEEGEESMHCSGVLIAPRLVLTAGHCVCARQEAPLAGDRAGFKIDGSKCARNALVTTVLYATSETGIAGSRSGEYKGDVRTHPEFKIDLDSQERVLSSNADLAIISLHQAVKGIAPLELLPLRELQGTESMVMISYGYDKLNAHLHGRRRFKDYKILKSLEAGGRFLFAQPQRDLYTGDSGGPCLRPTSQGDELVGISSRSLGQEPTFTSTYFYRDWLRHELSQARQSDAGFAP